MISNGIDINVAAAGISVIGGVSIVTRVEGGFIVDRVGKKETFLTSAGLASVCAFVLPFIHSNLLVYLILAGFGIALGPLASLWSPIILTRFGHENATATVGLLNIATALFALLAPLAVTMFRRVTGAYVVPLIVLGAITALGAGLFHWGRRQDESDPRDRACSTVQECVYSSQTARGVGSSRRTTEPSDDPVCSLRFGFSEILPANGIAVAIGPIHVSARSHTVIGIVATGATLDGENWMIWLGEATPLTRDSGFHRVDV